MLMHLATISYAVVKVIAAYGEPRLLQLAWVDYEPMLSLLGVGGS